MNKTFPYDKENLPITSLSLNITDSCNFNCRYCFVKQKPNHMSFQIADDAAKWLISNGKIYKNIFKTNPKLSILFFGGEPLLEWENIINPFVNKYPYFNYSITTNGFLLNESKIDFLSKNNFSVLLSMDGKKITQNYNRKENSFQQLDNIVGYLIDHIANCCFRGTIIPETCEHTFENIYYAQEKGFKRCYFTIDIFSSWNENKIELLTEELKKFTLAYINSFINHQFLIDFTPLTNMIKLIIKHELNILDNKINIFKCGLGNGYGAINYQGDIFTCQEIVTDDEHNELFKIGNIYTGINYQKLNDLRKIFINDIPIINNANNCEDCPLTFSCKKNSCQANNYICNNHCLIQSYNQCWWNQLLYKCAALSISVLQNLPNFQEYMKNIILEKEV